MQKFWYFCPYKIFYSMALKGVYKLGVTYKLFIQYHIKQISKFSAILKTIQSSQEYIVEINVYFIFIVQRVSELLHATNNINHFYIWMRVCVRWSISSVVCPQLCVSVWMVWCIEHLEHKIIVLFLSFSPLTTECRPSSETQDIILLPPSLFIIYIINHSLQSILLKCCCIGPFINTHEQHTELHLVVYQCNRCKIAHRIETCLMVVAKFSS